MHQFTWRAMGTEFTLYLPDGEREWAAGVAGELQEETRRLERQLSLYLPDSDLCYLNAHAHEQPVRVEPELFRLLQTCQSAVCANAGRVRPDRDAPAAPVGLRGQAVPRCRSPCH